MILTVPADDGSKYPTLGPQVVAWMHEHLVFGPGDLRGEPLRLDGEQQAFIWRFYELFPKGHLKAGRRRFRRCALSLAKGLRKTELAACIAAAELHPSAPVRFNGWRGKGLAPGKGVTDPYVVLVAYTEEQSDELAYGALRVILGESCLADDFDIGLERIIRKNGDGKAVSMASSPNARDGSRITFCVLDEPLAIDTPVPTPNGWTTMGTLREGDYVYDRRGRQVRVLGGSPVHIGRTCYRMTFSDGDTIVADAQHRWKAVSASNPAKEVVVTTEEMLCAGIDVAYGQRSGKRWSLPRNAGYDGVETLLPVDPYFLGLWLGDGDSRNATICVGTEDLPDTRRQIEACGYVVTECAVSEGRAPILYVTLPNARFSGWQVAVGGESQSRSVVGCLRSMGLLQNKHIPPEYMFASREQRLALLQGLMDSDGHISPSGTCVFTQGTVTLADQVCDLVRSLGTPARVTVRQDERARSGFGYKVNFTPSYPPFRLPRKLARYTPVKAGRLAKVVLIEPCQSVPVRCIAVDSDDHLFLAGRGLRLTHNTHWWTLPRLKQAQQTIMANLPKRKIADAWALETTTAPEPGAGSVAEATMEYARAVADGRVQDSDMFYYHRQAGDHHDLTTKDGARAAVNEASGVAAAWRDTDGVMSDWANPTTDRQYWERVWCNRLVQSSSQAFDAEQWKALTQFTYAVPDKALITLGFDGSVFHDATALVPTEVTTGYQWLAGLWERPYNRAEWQVPTAEVDAVVRSMFERYNVWRLYADPFRWESWIAKWQGEYGKERVIEWPTNRPRPMALAVAGFDAAIKESLLSHDGSPDYTRHIGNARRDDQHRMVDEQGKPLWTIRKDRPDSPHKMDAAMAGILSWKARTDAIAAGATAEPAYSLYVFGGQ